MDDKILLVGKIMFEPEDVTKKHESQSSWKYIAMVFLDGDVTEYYSWFLKKRYNLILNKPLRGAHISFINDSFRELSLNGQRNCDEVKKAWDCVKNKWNGINIPIMLNLNPKFDKSHWWLDVSHDHKNLLQSIRNELSLGLPFYHFHMSIGYANDKNISHHKYITSCIKNGLIKANSNISS
jgi:hypothetical protein